MTTALATFLLLHVLLAGRCWHLGATLSKPVPRTVPLGRRTIPYRVDGPRYDRPEPSATTLPGDEHAVPHRRVRGLLRRRLHRQLVAAAPLPGLAGDDGGLQPVLL